MTRFRKLLPVFFFVLGFVLGPASIVAQDSGGGLPSIEDKTASMRAIDGFIPMYWEASSGKLWLEISRWDTDILHMTGLASGLGSNDIGLDRGALSGSRLVRFHRVGPKVLMIQPNLDFRASSPNPREVQAVTDAFAPSTLWGFTAAAETDGRVLVDATDFVVRDMINWAQRLRPGTYRFDAGRSAVHLPMTMGFPENTEIEASLTFVRQPGGGGGFGGFGGGGGFEGVGNVASTGEAATIRLHHSFVQLPALGEYTPRAFDSRAGYGAMSYADYSAPLGEDMRVRFIRRHRLEKRDPSAAMSEPVEPIVYYLDPGAPEPIRTALLEGARWWNQAFEAAGFQDGFRVEMLPDGVSSHDVRYNVINWVHRSTRGWSTGGSVTDPRTGEILKGVVTLGSLRWRQDYLIAEGLLSPYANGDEVPEDIAEWALARIRQLSAHEVGHTLGLGHNYYDSSRGRISVLDYPHPLVTLGDDGRLDYSEVYDVDIGEWDKVAIVYGYSDFPEGTDEAAELRRILDAAWDEDLIYFTNQDINIHARADQWSNGVDAAAELERMMDVRRHSLDRFGEQAIRAGRPIATVEEALVPLYMHHRYQVDAAASLLGGQEYVYAFRGDGRTPMKRVSGGAQRAALRALGRTMGPRELAVPAGVLDLLPPRPPGFGRSRETFPRYTGPAFDAVTPAAVAADHTVSRVLEPSRAARLVQQHALDPSLPGLAEVLTALVDAVRPEADESPYHTELRLAAYRVLVDRIMALADGASMPHVRALATRKLVDLRAEMAANPPPESDAAFVQLVDRDIERFLEKPSAPYEMPGTPNAPPGAPIGEPAMDWLAGNTSVAGDAWTAAGPAGWAMGWLWTSLTCSADRDSF
ncbi:zinc-dependent metalloprotease [Candidatus Palauibacter sp.]|uniref:zinc-dependent metalloprotease n=1 Tax=Candidatus Palauibacter sp. TaxID=3101350 RepID=UPI003B524647